MTPRNSNVKSFDKDQGCAGMSLGEHREHPNVSEMKTKNHASIGVNQYGDGTVNTWNKNGY